jgi:hypothetical protein
VAIARADSWFHKFATAIDAGGSLGAQISASLTGLSGAHLIGWMAEGAAGTRPLAMLSSSERFREVQPRAAAPVMTIALTIDDMPWCGAGLLGSPRGRLK